MNERNTLGSGFSPIEIAVSQPHRIHPELLLDGYGYAKRVGELPQIVQLLLDAGANVSVKHLTCGTVLHMACAAQTANPQIVAALITAGADVHSKYSGFTLAPPGMEGDIQPIHYAASAGNAAIVQLLINAGADIEAATRNGIRPLDNAVMKMRPDIVEVLCAAGADMHTRYQSANSATRRSTEVEKLVSDTAVFMGVTDPWILARKRVEWDELAQWLSLRGCRASRGSMGLWGISFLNW